VASDTGQALAAGAALFCISVDFTVALALGEQGG